MAKLIVISGEERQEFELAAFNTIGRHPENTIQILDRIISKEHAQIQRAADGRFLLRDLRSLNGTFLRGERVSDHILTDGDEFTMGSTRIVFVDKPKADDALQRVTIAPGLTESHIRGRIQANTGDFMPERQIADDKILRRDYERLRIGHELARAVGSELDLDKLLPKILDKAFELVGADRGVILLARQGGRAACRSYVKTRSGKSDPNIVLSKTVMAEVENNKAAVLSSDATMDARFSGAHSIIMQGIRSTMTLPLLHAGDLLGIMHLDSLFTSNAFTEKDLQVCTGMAAQAAISIQNARLATRIEQRSSDPRADLAADPAERRRAGRQRRAQDRKGRPAQRSHDAVLRHPRLHDDVGRPARARDRQHLERVLRGDGRHPVQVHGHARQVRRRRDHRPVRRADRDRGRAVQGGVVRDRDAAGTRGVQPHARRRESVADPDRHRHQHRQRDHRVDRLDPRAAVHRDRRRDERGVAPRQRRRARARSSSRRARIARSPAASKRPRCRRSRSRARPRSSRCSA